MNPITYARMSAGLSKSELSKKLDLSRTYLIRAEQGCYVDPGKKLIPWTCRILNTDKDSLLERYKDFQFEKRSSELEYRNPTPLGNNVIIPPCRDQNCSEIYPHKIFKEWREDYWNTIVGFAGAMCVHPASVEQYENGKLSSMPNQLQDALQSMNLIANQFPVEERWFYGRLAS